MSFDPYLLTLGATQLHRMFGSTNCVSRGNPHVFNVSVLDNVDRKLMLVCKFLFPQNRLLNDLLCTKLQRRAFMGLFTKED